MLRRNRKLEVEDEKKDKTLPSDPFIVIKSGKLDDIIQMLHSGVNPNHTRWSGMSLLHRAAQMGLTDVSELLIMNGAEVDMKTAKGWYTPLHLAMYNGYIETANFLIQNGANPWSKSKYHEDAFDFGIKGGFKKLSDEFRGVIVKHEMMVAIKSHQSKIFSNNSRSSSPQDGQRVQTEGNG